MILSDDNFATIVFAVEAGRRIYDNLTKYIRFVLILLAAFVLTFLGAALFDIAGGEPFSPGQVLWIHFAINGVFGFALGFDQETPGLMQRMPRPRGQSVMTPSLLFTFVAVGAFISAALLALIEYGTSRFADPAVATSIAFTSFAFCLIVGAFESRSETASIFDASTFASRHMNRSALIEVGLTLAATQMDMLRNLLGTTQLHFEQYMWALVPAIVLLALWEAGKAVARRVGK
jgi:Ca2+-transporting ATPase